MFGLKLNNNIVSNFHQLEVVGRSSETQLQSGEMFNCITYRFKGKVLERTQIFFSQCLTTLSTDV